jgi:hypothetical protein
LVEHATENRSVGGSIPPLGTITPSSSFPSAGAIPCQERMFSGKPVQVDRSFFISDLRFK